MKPITAVLLFVLFLKSSTLWAATYHVSPDGDNANPGTRAEPFRTIQFAAEQAQPGDTITVHEDVYRERIDPPRGCRSDDERIVFQAAEGAQVTIKGSEEIGAGIQPGTTLGSRSYRMNSSATTIPTAR